MKSFILLLTALAILTLGAATAQAADCETTANEILNNAKTAVKNLFEAQNELNQAFQVEILNLFEEFHKDVEKYREELKDAGPLPFALSKLFAKVTASIAKNALKLEKIVLSYSTKQTVLAKGIFNIHSTLGAQELQNLLTNCLA